jgi:hypothetical protein
LLGWGLNVAGGMVHLLFVLAAIVDIANLATGGQTVGLCPEAQEHAATVRARASVIRFPATRCQASQVPQKRL